MTATDEECKTYNLHQLDYEGHTDLESIDIASVERLLEKPFGTLVVCFNWSDYEGLLRGSAKIKDLPFVFADSPHLNPENQVVVAPSDSFDFGFYQQVILVGHPLTEGYKSYIAKRVKTYALGDVSARPLKIADTTLRTAYRHIYELSAAKNRVQSMTRFYAYVSSRMNITETEFLVAVKIFEQLGLLRIGDRGMVEVSRRSVELSSSIAYRNLVH